MTLNDLNGNDFGAAEPGMRIWIDVYLEVRNYGTAKARRAACLTTWVTACLVGAGPFPVVGYHRAFRV